MRYSSPRCNWKVYLPTGNLRLIVPGKTKWSFQKGSGSAFRGRLPGPTRCMRQATGWWVLLSVTVSVSRPSPAAWATAGRAAAKATTSGEAPSGSTSAFSAMNTSRAAFRVEEL